MAESSFERAVRELRETIRQIPAFLSSSLGGPRGGGSAPYDPFGQANSPTPGGSSGGSSGNPPGGSQGSSSDAVGHILSNFGEHINRLVPGLSKFGSIISRLTNIPKFDSFVDSYKKISSESGKGLLKAVSEFSRKNRFVSQKDRENLAEMSQDLNKARKRAGYLGKQVGAERRDLESLSEKATESWKKSVEAARERGERFKDIRFARQEFKKADLAADRKFIDAKIQSQIATRLENIGDPGAKKARALANQTYFEGRKLQAEANKKRLDIGKARKTFDKANVSYRASFAAYTNAVRNRNVSASRLNQLKSRMKAAGQNVLSKQKALKTAVGGAASRAAGLASLARFATVAGAVVSLGLAAIKAVGALKDFAESVNAGNRRLAAYNANIAHAFGKLTMGDFRRTYDLSNRTEKSTVALTESINNMRDSWQDFNVRFGNARNGLAAFAADRSAAAGRIGGRAWELADRLSQGVTGQSAAGLAGNALWNATGFGIMWQLTEKGLEMALKSIKDIFDALGIKNPVDEADGPGPGGVWHDVLMGILGGRIQGNVMQRPRWDQRAVLPFNPANPGGPLMQGVGGALGRAFGAARGGP